MAACKIASYSIFWDNILSGFGKEVYFDYCYFLDAGMG